MANSIKRGESLFIPFKNGESIYDSQLKPRMYKTKEQYDKFVYRFQDAEMVEYAEVVRGYWIDSYSVDHTGRITEHGIDCSVCDSVFKADRRDVVQHWKERFDVCPFCGAIMDGGNEDGKM